MNFSIKIGFNPDPARQGQEVYFLKKTKNVNFQHLMFNGSKIESCFSQKHLCFPSDEKLNSEEHLHYRIIKYNKLIGIIKRLSTALSCDTLLTIYESLFRSHLDQMEILYDKPYNESSSIKSENVQYSYNRGYSWFILRQAFSGRGA